MEEKGHLNKLSPSSCWFGGENKKLFRIICCDLVQYLLLMDCPLVVLFFFPLYWFVSIRHHSHLHYIPLFSELYIVITWSWVIRGLGRCTYQSLLSCFRFANSGWFIQWSLSQVVITLDWWGTYGSFGAPKCCTTFLVRFPLRLTASRR